MGGDLSAKRTRARTPTLNPNPSRPGPTRTRRNHERALHEPPPIQSQFQEAIIISVLTPFFFVFYEALGPAEVGVEVSDTI